MAIESLLGLGGDNVPSFPFKNKGDKVAGILTRDIGEYHVRDFKTKEKAYFQNKKKVVESALVPGLPYQPILGLVIEIETKDGQKYNVWADGAKLKAVKAAAQEFGRIPGEGDMFVMEHHDVEELPGTSDRKLFRAQFKARKGE